MERILVMFVVKAIYKNWLDYTRVLYFGRDNKHIEFKNDYMDENYPLLEKFIDASGIEYTTKQRIAKKLNSIPKHMLIDGMEFDLKECNYIQFVVSSIGNYEKIIDRL